MPFETDGRHGMKERVSTASAIVAAQARRCLRTLLALVHPKGPSTTASTNSFSIEHQCIKFDVYRLECGEERHLRFYWKRRDGRPYASLSALRKELASQGRRLVFAVNGGIYSREMAPLGLYMEDGDSVTPLNSDCGSGNFFFKPNGVFSVSDMGARVVATGDYRQSGHVRQALQSGPMLVIGGELHPSFLPGYRSRQIRNGVGVDGEGRAVFAISDGVTNFHDFATLFRDRLDCPNALYLDGQLSRMYLPEMSYHAYCPWQPLVTIIGLSKSIG